MPPLERFQALAAWVLPGPDHPTIRLQGTFTPLDPATVDVPTEGTTPPSGRSRVQLGGRPESPAADLVEVARSAGKLDELAGRVESARGTSPVDDRGKFALLAMSRLAQGREAQAVAAFASLKGLASTIKPSDADWMRWPELTASWAALSNGKAEVRASALACLEVPTKGPDQPLGASDLWVRQVRQALAIEGETVPTPWAMVAPARALDRGRGFPRSSWTSSGGVWSNQSGRPGESLLLGVPIRGDFEASVDLSASTGREANLSYAGLSIRVRPDRKGITVRQADEPPTEVNLSPPLEVKGDWLAWKLKVVEARMVVSVDGRTLFERSIPAEADPWLAIEAPGSLGGSARNFALTGKPVVPERIRLSTLTDLVGWSSAESPAWEAGNDSSWRKRGDEIIGRSTTSEPTGNGMNNNMFNRGGFNVDFVNGQQPQPTVVGSKIESVLRLARPMLEDGAIEYEFYHEPGKAMVHPSLGRLAFVIQPDGVALHRLTDTPYERAGLDPGNLTVEPTRRRGPASPPLVPKAWNRLKFALIGGVATITLNDVLIYERPIEATNSRSFGLFHHADEAEARVRDVTQVGEWPRTIPPSLAKKPD
jgi:hypothetical protein